MVVNLSPATPVCPLCEGILPAILDEHFGPRLCVIAHISKYEFDEVQLNLLLPLSLMIRNHSISIFLQEFAPELYGEGKAIPEILAVKEYMKWILHDSLSTWLQVPYNSKSALSALLTFDHPHTQVVYGTYNCCGSFC